VNVRGKHKIPTINANRDMGLVGDYDVTDQPLYVKMQNKLKRLISDSQDGDNFSD